ncbi:DUF1934 domain-containing protein [Anaeromicropila populeti]|uniref:Uncharacterized beta-barrel protein YwiB, DUF1934 family n=1 Tax=Anaeromicropila populeti TaxID=37658 RepID=A0A1I6I6D9_9FIRM|nr:DUF1934 domain-containing protein [Anaeromicropila populeti]SFR62224.1 Uncharacterized beta-barrel protein YwiB, DUF1934 family [Anaeromicropila populeti]
MTRDVIISIKGLQFEAGEDESVELIATGQYFYKNQKHYVLYEEVIGDEDQQGGISKNTIKISNQQVDIIKDGCASVHMIFEVDKKNMTYYNMPFGNILIGIYTNKIAVKEEDNQIEVQLEYDLEVNYTHVSECTISIKVLSKEAAATILSGFNA